jgi:hypothetical protein
MLPEALSVAPLAGGVCFAGFIVSLRLRLAPIAWVDLPDPHDHPVGRALVTLAMACVLCLIPIWELVVRLQPDAARQERLSRRFWTLWAGWTLYASLDPGRFIEWFKD